MNVEYLLELNDIYDEITKQSLPIDTSKAKEILLMLMPHINDVNNTGHIYLNINRLREWIEKRHISQKIRGFTYTGRALYIGSSCNLDKNNCIRECIISNKDKELFSFDLTHIDATIYSELIGTIVEGDIYDEFLIKINKILCNEDDDS